MIILIAIGLTERNLITVKICTEIYIVFKIFIVKWAKNTYINTQNMIRCCIVNLSQIATPTKGYKDKMTTILVFVHFNCRIHFKWNPVLSMSPFLRCVCVSVVHIKSIF